MPTKDNVADVLDGCSGHTTFLVRKVRMGGREREEGETATAKLSALAGYGKAIPHVLQSNGFRVANDGGAKLVWTS